MDLKMSIQKYVKNSTNGCQWNDLFFLCIFTYHVTREREREREGERERERERETHKKII